MNLQIFCTFYNLYYDQKVNNPVLNKQCCSQRVLHSCLLYVTLMPSGLLHCMCNDCGPTRAYPVWTDDIEEGSYKGQTLIWPLPALSSSEVAQRSRLVVWAVGDEWLYLVGRLLQFHTNWGVNTKSKCGNWVTWLWLYSLLWLFWPWGGSKVYNTAHSYYCLFFVIQKILMSGYWVIYVLTKIFVHL